MEQTYVRYLCDFCGAELEKAAPVKITMGGRTYEVDLCEDDRKPIDELQERLKETRSARSRNTATASNGHGRPAQRTRRVRHATAEPEGPVPATERVPNDKTAEYSTTVREWAIANGMDVGERGRISPVIVAAYQEAYKAYRRTAPKTTAA